MPRVFIVAPGCEFDPATGRNVCSVFDFASDQDARRFAAGWNHRRANMPAVPSYAPPRAVVEGDPVSWFSRDAARRFYAHRAMPAPDIDALIADGDLDAVEAAILDAMDG